MRDGEAVAVAGDPDHPVNQGRLAPRASRSTTHRGRGRLTAPRVDGIETDGTPPWTGWSAAFRRLLDEHGHAVAVISTGQLVTEEFYALGGLVRLGMGLRHFDGNTTLCMWPTVSGLQAQPSAPTARRVATTTS